MITFKEIPDALRYPGAYVEIDGSMAGLGNDLPIVLLVGQKLATGTAPAGEVVRISSVQDAVDKAGAGSMLAQMAKAYRKNDETFDLFMLPYADLPAGVQAHGGLSITTPPTEDGVFYLYIAQRPISVGVTAGMSTTQVAAAVVSAIGAAGLDIPVTASSAANVVTLAARHKGTCGNGIDLRLSLYGEDVPAGLSVSIFAMSGGAGDPDAGDLSNIVGTKNWFRYIGLGINSTAFLAAWHAESQARYKPPIQAGFRAFTALRGGTDTAASFGETKNYEHICCLALGYNPMAPWEAAAALVGAAAPKLWNNPVISLEGTEISGMVGVDYFNFTNANTLLYKGMSLIEVTKDGSCYIKRLISMYQYRSDGSADDSYLDINVAEVMERIRYEQRIGAIQRFRGTVAAKTDEGFRPGLPITTEDAVRAYLLSLYKHELMANKGWVQGYDFYKTNLIVEQNADNPSRFDYRDDPVINSPFYILAGRSRFRKAVPTY